MKPLIKLKTTTLLVIPLVLACFALLPRAQGETQAETISPAVFAELPGFNTAAGFHVLSVNTGTFNSGFGALALEDNTTGHDNTALGAQALRNNTIGFQNTAVGENALVFNIDGDQNMALGQGALANNLHGNANTAIGFQALNINTVSGNAAIGFQALRANTNGTDNNAFGFQALGSNQTGDFNNAHGRITLLDNVAGSENNAFGDRALLNSTGSGNTGIGDDAGLNMAGGSNNTCLGNNSGTGITTASGVTTLGAIAGGNETNRTWIKGANVIQSFSAGVIDYVTVRLSDGRIGATAVVSSRRYKDNIKPMGSVSDAILKLKPVTFHLKKEIDDLQLPGFGLIAEDVEEVNPDLVYHNEKGQPESVRYDAINALLLNEFLKEHKKVEEQQASIVELKSTVALQQKGMEVLTAQLKEQAAQIQRVSAQVEMSKPAPRTVANK